MKKPSTAFDKIQPVIAALLDDSETDCLFQVYHDVHALFKGRYPGYRACNTGYHDFSHTISVVSASVRLLDGCIADGIEIPTRPRLLALIAAFFHDVGLIQTEDDLHGSGAKYTLGHEERSIRFAKSYLFQKKFAEEEIENCADMIRCTILSLNPSQIPFSSAAICTCGHIVGSADLLGQLADRFYLEKLLFLFKELQEAGIPDIGKEVDFFRRSKEFYESVAKKRLQKELGGVDKHLLAHFKKWMGVDTDLYAKAIARNHTYLDRIIDNCQNSLECCLEFLRRGDIEAYLSGGRPKN
jgi:hypothetical protein